VQFVELCRLMGLLTSSSVAIDGSKFKAVNTRDKNLRLILQTIGARYARRRE
jgi:transposase